ncbi:MAG: single-stranded DNA-binding protein [Gammaproteobacteria bacterium]|nr:single-stranded DNA-binding protein [Gammaproteobacteria bacterium]
MTIYASIHGRPAVDPKPRTSSNGNNMTTAFMLVNLDVHGSDEPVTLACSLLAFGTAALELARATKGESITAAGQLRGSRYDKNGETVEGYQLLVDHIITTRTARSSPRKPKGNGRTGEHPDAPDDELNDRVPF